MSAAREISDLVDRFKEHADTYRFGAYNETQLRREFVDLELHKQAAAAKTDHEQTAIQRQIDATDARIDKLVYELYGLSGGEIKIVEGAA